MRKYFFILGILLVAANSHAQQMQASSMYDMQGVFYNPSMAGVTGNLFGVSYRTQWSSIEGAPKTATVFGSAALPSLKIGLGGYIYNDKTGPTSRTGVSLAFAKHITTGNEGTFSVGIDARGQQYSIDRAKLTETLGSDPAIGSSENRFVFDAGFGISFSNKKFQVGAAVSQLVQSKLDFYTGDLNRTEEGRLYRHYYFHGQYNFEVDDVTTISPNLMVTYLPNAPTEYQGGVRVEHNKLFWWGAGFRARQSWILSAGLHIKQQFTIGYSFDIYKTPVSIYTQGGNAHELMMRFKFSK